jgi:hypothetical protein
MKIAPTTTRRAFLKSSLVAGAAVGVPALVRGANLNSRVQIATVGVNGKGYGDLHNFFQHEKVKYVGFCDIDTRAFEKADKLIPGVPHFADFREMYSKLGDTLDAVDVATPDHMHALASIEAMKRGKHVYCQKPLAHTVWECRQMQLWAAKKGLVTQMGNQIHSAVEYRMATRLIREGAIGKVKEVHSWLLYTGNERTRLLEPPAGATPVPKEVNWDLWLGGAPKRSYAPLYHPFAWRDWQDFGGGGLGDFGCHRRGQYRRQPPCLADGADDPLCFSRHGIHGRVDNQGDLDRRRASSGTQAGENAGGARPAQERIAVHRRKGQHGAGARRRSAAVPDGRLPGFRLPEGHQGAEPLPPVYRRDPGGHEDHGRLRLRGPAGRDGAAR